MGDVMTPTAWNLFEKIFQPGEEVVIITDDDRFHWGRLTYNSVDVLLQRLTGKKEIIPWSAVRFISHDGFPVKKLTGADGSRLIEKVDAGDIQTTIINTLLFRLCPECKNLTENKNLCISCEIKIQKEKSMRVGDPYDIECVKPILLKEGPWCGLRKPWNNPNADCLHLIASDGAVGQLYTLETVYMFE